MLQLHPGPLIEGMPDRGFACHDDNDLSSEHSSDWDDLDDLDDRRNYLLLEDCPTVYTQIHHDKLAEAHELLREYNRVVDYATRQIATIVGITRIARSWGDPDAMLDEYPESQEYKPFWDFLRAQQKEYRRRYRKQQQLLITDEFFMRVAAAVARMPRANTIQFHDLDLKQGPQRGVPFDDVDPRDPCKALKRHGFFLQPEPLLYGLVEDEDQYFIPFMGLVLWALQQAGRLPKAIDIFLPGTNCQRDPRIYDTRPLSLLPDSGTALYPLHPLARSALHNLESLTLAVHDDLLGSRPSQRANLEHFLAPFLASRSLRKLPTESIGRILAYKPSPCLTEISLRAVGFTHRELVSLLQSIKHPMHTIEISKANLLAGFWADVFDLLRDFDCRYKHIEYARGGELDCVERERYRSMRDVKCSGYESMVDAYINGVDMENPTRIHPPVQGNFILQFLAERTERRYSVEDQEYPEWLAEIEASDEFEIDEDEDEVIIEDESGSDDTGEN
ncbi:hypothetical protein QBC47DRAFT_407768 [Echria macrotheca]|uniref:Uncharacterized protein n=1 Tax=Echria macrotheca TaxID=438768 RepID=A0AAJ0F175_9PEZI|nr:hypothetical protein QBC47DRAFT_407768 [Echria macrotheca]